MRALFLIAAATATSFLGTITQPAPDTEQSTRNSARQPVSSSVDAVIGPGEFNRVFPVHPGSRDDVNRQITARLIYLEELLRSRDVSGWPAELRAERARNLDRLHAYRVRGEYPVNYDHPDRMLPCFIDRDGNICGVGYLVQQSAGDAFARAINAKYQYSTIREMDSPELKQWIARSGLTEAEVVTIQVPEWNGGRGGRPTITGIRVDSAVALRGVDSIATSPVQTGSDRQGSPVVPAVAVGDTLRSIPPTQGTPTPGLHDH
jgi:hypothetical protein